MKEYPERKVGLSSAIGHLHSRRILYRDLKPENISFLIFVRIVLLVVSVAKPPTCITDSGFRWQRNEVKLFDFGLAKELTDAYEATKNGLNRLTAMPGSPRYMVRCNKELFPPQPAMGLHLFYSEVAMEHPYNESCDAYSFGILFWEIFRKETFGIVWNG